MTRHDPNHCARCGYPLTGLTQVCSECGFETDLEPPPPPLPAHWSDDGGDMTAGLLLMVAAVVSAASLMCIVLSRGFVAFAREWQASAALVCFVFTILGLWWRAKAPEEGSLMGVLQSVTGVVLAIVALLLLLKYAT